MSTIGTGAWGVSPTFQITAEELTLNYFTAIIRIAIDGVEPPTLGAFGGHSEMFNRRNVWSPWIDDKLIEPKYDGVCQFTGQASNRPTVMKDYHIITLMRAVDAILAPRYVAQIVAQVGTVLPAPPPTV
jgi:hypothetical protein